MKEKHVRACQCAVQNVCTHIYASYAHFFSQNFMQIVLIVQYYVMALSLNFHKDPCFCWDMLKICPVFFSPPLRPFLIEGVLWSKNLFCESCLECPKTSPRRQFWGPLAAIWDFAGGAALQAVRKWPRHARLVFVSKSQLFQPHTTTAITATNSITRITTSTTIWPS